MSYDPPTRYDFTNKVYEKTPVQTLADIISRNMLQGHTKFTKYMANPTTQAIKHTKDFKEAYKLALEQTKYDIGYRPGKGRLTRKRNKKIHRTRRHHKKTKKSRRSRK